MQPQTHNPENVKKLAEKIKGIRIAMLTTVDEDGRLVSRPMGTQEAEFDGTLWFFTQASSPKVGDVQQEQQVNVAYAKPGSDTFISVSGTATLVRDKTKIQELWKPVFKAWFPNGLDDPDLALLRVDATQAEYWDAPGGPVVTLVGLAKSLITHQPANDVGTDEKLTF
jgi:general stress protein 26